MVAFVDRSELEGASGVLIDGFDSEDIVQVLRRRKRETADDENEECKAKCQLKRKRWTGPVSDEQTEEAAADYNGQDWSSFVAERATSTTRCLAECSNDN